MTAVERVVDQKQVLIIPQPAKPLDDPTLLRQLPAMVAT